MLPSGVNFFSLSKEKCFQQILRLPLPTDQVTALKNKTTEHEDCEERESEATELWVLFSNQPVDLVIYFGQSI